MVVLGIILAYLAVVAARWVIAVRYEPYVAVDYRESTRLGNFVEKAYVQKEPVLKAENVSRAIKAQETASAET